MNGFERIRSITRIKGIEDKKANLFENLLLTFVQTKSIHPKAVKVPQVKNVEFIRLFKRIAPGKILESITPITASVIQSKTEQNTEIVNNLSETELFFLLVVL